MTNVAETPPKHATVFDVDVEKLAKVYAQAALGAAGDASEELTDELQSLIVDVLDKFPALEEMFSTALVSQEEKIRLLDSVFASRMSTTGLNFLKTLAQHDRLGLLRDVVRMTVQLSDERLGRIPVEVRLAHPAEDSFKKEITKTLGEVLGADPVVEIVVDPSLIAGFVVRIQDKVYDSSVRTSFERARQTMIASAIETIQNKPQRFMEN